jgi:hypothetical protein
MHPQSRRHYQVDRAYPSDLFPHDRAYYSPHLVYPHHQFGSGLQCSQYSLPSASVSAGQGYREGPAVIRVRCPFVRASLSAQLPDRGLGKVERTIPVQEP